MRALYSRQAPIPAFCSSDEEEEDTSALLYLPIAPEVGQSIEKVH